jgi:hypothetical protein
MSSESDGEGKVLRGFRELGTLNRLSPEIRSQSHIGPKIRVWGHTASSPFMLNVIMHKIYLLIN